MHCTKTMYGDTLPTHCYLLKYYLAGADCYCYSVVAGCCDYLVTVRLNDSGSPLLHRYSIVTPSLLLCCRYFLVSAIRSVATALSIPLIKHCGIDLSPVPDQCCKYPALAVASMNSG